MWTGVLLGGTVGLWRLCLKIFVGAVEEHSQPWGFTICWTGGHSGALVLVVQNM